MRYVWSRPHTQHCKSRTSVNSRQEVNHLWKTETNWSPRQWKLKRIKWRQPLMFIYAHTYLIITYVKSSPVTGPVWPRGFQEVWTPRFHDIRHMKVMRLPASRVGRLYHQECSWYSFSLGAESIPGPWYGRKEYVTEKSSDTTGNRSRDCATSSAAP
jgi:hypothetical protein